MSNQNKNKNEENIIKRGLLISKTMLFRLLMKRATGIYSSPSKISEVLGNTYQKFKQYDNASQMTTDVVAGFFLFSEMLKSWAKGEYKGFENSKVLYIIGALLYLISPLDIVPDGLPIIGFLDDLSVMAWIYASMRDEVEQYVLWKKENKVETEKLSDRTYDELYAMAQAVELKGRSGMNKKELIENLQNHN